MSDVGLGLSPSPLPMSRAEMEQRGWDGFDFVLITGDAYVAPRASRGLSGNAGKCRPPCKQKASGSRADGKSDRV